ncbi:MAG: hypothetical protein L0I29_05985 [Hyphomicrobiales bacterium]|nr:hypothetical protein [Hyphomicrobiales bacterium]
MNRRRLMASFALLGATTLLATACGRRPTELDTPYQAAVDARKEAQDQKTTPLPPEPKKPETDRRFFLDGLIK